MRLLNKSAIGLIKLYQVCLSPYFGAECKFSPSCSEFACDCFRHFGLIKSSRMVLWRLLRCNPWSHGGYDPAIKKTCH